MTGVVQNIGFHNSDFNQKLFSEVVRNISPDAECVDFQQVPFSAANGHVSSITSTESNCQRFLGFRAFLVTYKDNAGDSSLKSCHVVFKVKAKGLDAKKRFVDSFRTMLGETAAKGYDE